MEETGASSVGRVLGEKECSVSGIRKHDLVVVRKTKPELPGDDLRIASIIQDFGTGPLHVLRIITHSAFGEQIVVTTVEGENPRMVSPDFMEKSQVL